MASRAGRIKILADSAGARALGPALAALQRRLRLGEVDYAAPDVDFTGCPDALSTDIGMPQHLTMAANRGDLLLGMAAG